MPVFVEDAMLRIAVVVLAAIVIATPSRAEGLRVLAAGSLTDAFSDLARRFPAAPDSAATVEFGPSGLLREKIEAGALADILASADMDNARRLAVGYPERTVINFARNRLCVLARGGIGLTPANMLERLLDPSVRLATSTPGADPGGDYAWAVFARAEALHPGARATLEAKAQKLVGGGDKTPPLVPGKGAVEGVFLSDRADVMLGYCSSAEPAAHAVPGLAIVPLPPELTVEPAYGMVLLNARPATLRWAAFVMSEAGQAVLRAHGFAPTALAGPVQPSHDLLVLRAGQPVRLIPPERIAALHAVTQHAAIEHTDREWTGPLLWDVLIDAGAVDPQKPSEQVHLGVRVTGADGWMAVFGLAELGPQFANRPIQLANRVNGEILPDQGLRLIVPGEQRGGRSVSNVVRVDVE
jgi:molybdate transport system substrate-binding protein